MTFLAPALLSEHACFGGVQRVYQHASREIGLPMKFSVYLPPQALQGAKRPALMYLAGLTCNEDTFMTKAGAQRLAAELGLILVAPDTSPRGAQVPGEADAWDFGVGAGFYLDATQTPWAAHWRMESYLIARVAAPAGRAPAHGPGAGGDFWPFHGRARCAHAGAAPPGGVQERFGLCTHLPRPASAPGGARPLAATWGRTRAPGLHTMPVR